MATGKATPIEVLPPEAQDMHPFNKPVQFNVSNTLQSPLFWVGIGMLAMFGLQHYLRKNSKGN